MPAKKAFSRTQELLLSVQMLGDAVLCFVALSLAFFVRFYTPVQHLGVDVTSPAYASYLPLLSLGTIFFLMSLAYLQLYDARLLLRPRKAAGMLVRAVFFWFLIFLSASLVLKFEPPISRIFAGVGCSTTLVVLVAWRYAFHRWLSISRWRERLIQRIVLVGWTDDAADLATAILHDWRQPYRVVGFIGPRPPLSRPVEWLGELTDYQTVLAEQETDIVIVTDVNLPREKMLEIATFCGRTYVEFKVVPSFFQIFASSLRPQTISGIPILGVEDLRIAAIPNQVLKRFIDVVGALVGLFLSLPVVIAVSILIRREDPGPAIFRQQRIGRNGAPFAMYKLRSMRLDADKYDHLNQSTLRDDPRMLKIGKLIRQWNLDELPQFWNVLKGDMSLVGPRPERILHADRLAEQISYYNSRHLIKPGLTGWAQIHGLRGDTDLVARIKYDHYYIENWSFWLDFQILLMTFFRRENAY